MERRAWPPRTCLSCRCVVSLLRALRFAVPAVPEVAESVRADSGRCCALLADSQPHRHERSDKCRAGQGSGHSEAHTGRQAQAVSNRSLTLVFALCASFSSSAWHFHTHLRRLFAARPAARPGAETWNALDGWRGILCLWMVAFHSFFYVRPTNSTPRTERERRQIPCTSCTVTCAHLVDLSLLCVGACVLQVGNFVNDDAMHEVGLSPALLVLNLGFLPVDGFFVLTGFLIAYPLFKEEHKRIKAIKEAEGDRAAAAVNSDQKASGSVWSFDLGTFYYRRVTRMLPSYILAIYFHCGILFPNLIQHSMDVVRSDGFRNFIDRVLPDLKDAPNNCTPGYLFTNLTWTNHLMPFGGCCGWTWSFALQFNFYLFFPLLWKWAHARLAKKQSSSSSSPSAFVLPFLYVFLVFSLFVRFVSFLQIRRFDLRHEEGIFMGFFWYSNTFTRGGAIVWGVLAAYASVHTNLVRWLRTHTAVVKLGWIAAASIVCLQMFWSRIFADGNMIETPGWSSMELTQKLGGPNSLNYTTPNLQAYWGQALFQILVLVGSPGSNLLFVFLLLMVVNGLGRLGGALQRFLSLPLFYPLSTLSWWVYLVHPAIMIRYYAFHIEHLGEIDMSVRGVMLNAGLQMIFSFGTALVAYTFIEQPLEILLRQGESVATTATKPVATTSAAAPGSSSKPAASAPATAAPATFFTRLRLLIFVYCVLCMIYIVLHHAAMITAVTQLEPKEYVLKPNAIPTRNNGLRVANKTM